MHACETDVGTRSFFLILMRNKRFSTTLLTMITKSQLNGIVGAITLLSASASIVYMRLMNKSGIHPFSLDILSAVFTIPFALAAFVFNILIAQILHFVPEKYFKSPEIETTFQRKLFFGIGAILFVISVVPYIRFLLNDDMTVVMVLPTLLFAAAVFATLRAVVLFLPNKVLKQAQV